MAVVLIQDLKFDPPFQGMIMIGGVMLGQAEQVDRSCVHRVNGDRFPITPVPEDQGDGILKVI